MLDNKNKFFWPLGFGVSMLLNCFLIYFLIDNGITNSYREEDVKRYIREKDDAVAVLNWLIKTNPDFMPALTKQAFSRTPDKLFKIEDERHILLGELCFKKEQMYWSVQYCDEVYNRG